MKAGVDIASLGTASSVDRRHNDGLSQRTTGMAGRWFYQCSPGRGAESLIWIKSGQIRMPATSRWAWRAPLTTPVVIGAVAKKCAAFGATAVAKPDVPQTYINSIGICRVSFPQPWYALHPSCVPNLKNGPKASRDCRFSPHIDSFFRQFFTAPLGRSRQAWRRFRRN
jgi:hypothetical protein